MFKYTEEAKQRAKETRKKRLAGDKTGLKEINIDGFTEEQIMALPHSYNRLKFHCLDCGISYSISTKDIFKGFYCRRCSYIRTCQQKYGVSHVPRKFWNSKQYENIKKPIVEINGFSEEQVKDLGYMSSPKFNCKDCGKEVILTNKYSFNGFYCRRCNMERTFTANYGNDFTKVIGQHISETKRNLPREEVKASFEKQRKTMIERYGVDNAAKSEEVKKKIRVTSEKRYGGIGYASPELKEKADITTIERYGSIFGSGKYKYDDKIFDSSWELYLYRFLQLRGVEFEFHPNIPLEYFVPEENKTRKYFPDFKIGNRLVEIKGGQFFDKETDEPICPFNRNDDAAFKAKFQKMAEYKVYIIRNIEPYKRFVLSKDENFLIENFKA